MSNKHLRNKSSGLRVNKESSAAWYYEEPQGWTVVVETKRLTGNGQTYSDYVQVTIPWRVMRASLARKEQER